MVLAEASAVERVRRAMIEAFADEFGREPEIFRCAVADGARVVAKEAGVFHQPPGLVGLGRGPPTQAEVLGAASRIVLLS